MKFELTEVTVHYQSCCAELEQTVAHLMMLIHSNLGNAPTQALHVYRLNVDVDSRNALMLGNLAPQSSQYIIKVRDARAGQTAHICLSAISDNVLTGGLLKLAIGARVANN